MAAMFVLLFTGLGLDSPIGWAAIAAFIVGGVIYIGHKAPTPPQGGAK